jgi:hypothetical protein
MDINHDEIHVLINTESNLMIYMSVWNNEM